MTNIYKRIIIYDNMISIRCDKCKNSFEVNEKNVDNNLDFMQCPNCGSITNNPLRKIE